MARGSCRAGYERAHQHHAGPHLVRGVSHSSTEKRRQLQAPRVCLRLTRACRFDAVGDPSSRGSVNGNIGGSGVNRNRSHFQQICASCISMDPVAVIGEVKLLVGCFLSNVRSVWMVMVLGFGVRRTVVVRSGRQHVWLNTSGIAQRLPIRSGRQHEPHAWHASYGRVCVERIARLGRWLDRHGARSTAPAGGAASQEQ